MKISERTRFWRSISFRESGCWEWKKYVNRDGYGIFWRSPTERGAKAKKIFAHRYSFEACFGPVPIGTELDHVCRNPSCVNPMHLEAVTHRENILRGKNPCAEKARQISCKYGHAFDTENTILKITGSGINRQCRTCSNRRAREKQKRKRERSNVKTPTRA